MPVRKAEGRLSGGPGLAPLRIAGGPGLQTMQIIGGALGVAGGGKNETLVVLQYLEP